MGCSEHTKPAEPETVPTSVASLSAGRNAMTGKFTYHGGGVLSKVRSDGKRVYYIRYMYQGKRITEKVGLKEEKARGRIEARREAMEDPSYIPTPVKRAKEKAGRLRRIKFREFAKRFLVDHASKRRSESTWFRPMTNRMCREFGSLYLDELSHYRLERFITRRRKKVEPATANHDIRYLKNMLSRAVEWGFLKESPAARLKQLKEPPPRERFLRQEETDRLLAHCRTRRREDGKFDRLGHLRPVIQTALLTGMRRGEILGLTWDRIHFDQRMIYVERTKSGEPRWIPMGDDLVELLRSLPRHVAHNRVFTYQGRPVDTLKHSWETLRKLAGLPGVRFHDLRHTWASRMVAAGVDLYELMEMGGWRSISMVRRYAHFAPDRKVRTAKLLDGTAGKVATLVASQPGQSGHSVKRKDGKTA